MRKRIFGVLMALSLLASCTAEKPPQSQREETQTCSARLATDPASTRKIAPTDLKVGVNDSTPVISNAQKFIIPVPAFGQSGEPLVYPPSYEKAGQAIVDYTGKPVGGSGTEAARGLVFFNGKDKSWQAVKGDGEGVIIINEVTPEQAKALDQNVQSFKPDSNNLGSIV
jgi:hypothetical protein